MTNFLQRKIHALAFLLGAAILTGSLPAAPQPAAPRDVISLDGTWQIAEGGMDVPPTTFERTVPVPGLVTLATPAFTPEPGPAAADRLNPRQKDPARDAFWYRRTFRLDQPVPAVARLKVAKAMFGSQVILNGQMLGGQAASFTPAYYDARAALRPGENVLLIRVGADRDAVPTTVPTGFDPEKVRYPPGIFDSVELILSGTPYFRHVQTVPDIVNGKVRVQAVLRANADQAEPVRTSVAFVVREAKSGRIVGRATSEVATFGPGQDTTVEASMPIADCRLWSPEDPFLYRLEADSGTDRFTTRFGMREFKFDPATRHARLNGKPYFLRGSNITLYRFFEDPECSNLPWRADWVRLLHERMKDMHWNSLRYCIGFPPEAWYDLADELGILIQDEYPFWGDDGIMRDQLQQEFTAWMQERWNHPCVVIWDARNEGHGKPTSPTSESAAAIAAVRGLDLSNRPWDNGWGEVGDPGDSLEAHTYHYASHAGSYRFTLADLAHVDRTPRAAAWRPDDGQHAIIFNEYGWIWLNRDGSPTTLSTEVYRNLLGENSTPAQRFHLYARMLSAESEFWRSYRKAAGVLHFASLAYSRADGQTSDHWADIEKLIWEPEFERYVRDAFAPVGLMIDFWNDIGISGKTTRVPVRLINDLEKPWSGAVTLRLRAAAGGALLHEQKQDCRLDAYGDTTVNFDVTWPAPAGACILEAELPGADGKPVRSTRELSVVDVQSLGLAFGRSASASSFRSPTDAPGCAVDGDLTTWWFSADEKPAWLAVDLGEVRRISRVRVTWAVAYSTAFTVQASRDGETWVDLHTETAGTGGVSEIRFAPLDARHVRINTLKPTKVGPVMRMEPGHAIRELQVFE